MSEQSRRVARRRERSRGTPTPSVGGEHPAHEKRGAVRHPVSDQILIYHDSQERAMGLETHDGSLGSWHSTN